jgi:hypothetical protein
VDEKQARNGEGEGSNREAMILDVSYKKRLAVQLAVKSSNSSKIHEENFSSCIDGNFFIVDMYNIYYKGIIIHLFYYC